jgi:feruloyl-CoA synthase
VDIASWDVAVTQETCGALRVRPYLELGPYPKKLTESLDYWAEHAPDRTFLAKRDQRGVWQHLNFSQFRSVARNVAQALLNLGMTPEHPIAILSGNDLEHAILGMAAMRPRQAAAHFRFAGARPGLRRRWAGVQPGH